MKIGKLAEIITNREGLFNIVLEKEPGLSLGDKQDQVRNLVHRGVYKDKNVYVKVGLTENLANLIEFYSKSLNFKFFKIPKLLSFGNFIYEDLEFTYLVEKEVLGKSLYESQDFANFNKVLIDIILEIYSIPNLGLLNTEKRLAQLHTVEGYNSYKEKLVKLLTSWYENSQVKYPKVLACANRLLEDFESLELGTAHGEFNLHHIFTDETGKVSIIDWERFSQATLRFFDLQEYLGRLLVFQTGFDSISKIMTEFKNRVSFNKKAFEYSLYHRVLGSLYEATVDKTVIKITQNDETRILDFIKESLY